MNIDFIGLMADSPKSPELFSAPFASSQVSDIHFRLEGMARRIRVRLDLLSGLSCLVVLVFLCLLRDLGIQFYRLVLQYSRRFYRSIPLVLVGQVDLVHLTVQLVRFHLSVLETRDLRAVQVVRAPL